MIASAQPKFGSYFLTQPKEADRGGQTDREGDARPGGSNGKYDALKRFLKDVSGRLDG